MPEGSDVQWVKIREEPEGRKPRLSWHVFATYTRVDNGAQTLCKRKAQADTMVDDVPGGEKTCESCLRTLVQ